MKTSMIQAWRGSNKMFPPNVRTCSAARCTFQDVWMDLLRV